MQRECNCTPTCFFYKCDLDFDLLDLKLIVLSGPQDHHDVYWICWPCVRSFLTHCPKDIKTDRQTNGTHAMVTTTIRLWFNGHSTAVQRSLRSRWRNMVRWPASRCHADLFHYWASLQQSSPGRRMLIVEWSSTVERQSTRCNHRFTATSSLYSVGGVA